MTSSRKNKTLFIDAEAASALEMLKNGLLKPATKLMNSKESEEVLKTGLINGQTFPFPFILAPSGKMNHDVLKSLEVGEEITLISDKVEFAKMIVEEVFEIEPKDRKTHV